MLIDVMMFIGGLFALYYGAEWLVAGSSSIALRAGIPTLVVGLTVVAFGTSAPELLVSVVAIIEGTDDISVGNIIGSNIANIALILGCASLIRPIQVSALAVRREYPLMLFASVLLAVCVYVGGELSRIDGMILLGGMISYLVWSFVRARREMSESEDEIDEEDLTPEELAELDPESGSTALDALKVALGIVGLAAGAWLMVESAVSIATELGISKLVIGISVVALGTSLPELATSVVAAYREESDISVGNVIGSNIFNIGMVLGIVACIHPLNVGSDALRYDLPVMLVVAVLIWPIMRSGYRINRLEGIALLVGYVVYMISLFVR
jgi:cation:H+ antiporter